MSEDKTNQPVITLIGPPFSGLKNILEILAEGQNWQILSPPSAEQILVGDQTWLNNLDGGNNPWVFPALEKTFLRQSEGLTLMRNFLDLVYAGKLGQGIIVCDSWAWAFLQHIWREKIPLTLTLQAFDKDRITDYLQEFSGALDGRKMLYRQSDNGKYVLPHHDSEDNLINMSNFLQMLAAHSRGIFGVAYSFWRFSPRIEPDKSDLEEDDHSKDNDQALTIWITPFDQLKHPSLPSAAGRDEASVLYSLLLHNGLPLELIRQILPLSQTQVMETLLILEDAGLVSHCDDIWHVLPRGYPAVREFIQSQGFLIDQF